jgi:15-cis-phytoene synthase
VSRLTLYDRVAEETTAVIIRRYSTSFGLASRLLEPRVRQHVENIYALVRIADEIVDGGAADAGLDPLAAGSALDEFERETDAAIDSGFSTNLVIHAFALSARAAGFGTELTKPFFESMRMDLSTTVHDQKSFDAYVYGSAQVVGLMCLRAFMIGRDVSAADLERLDRGAQALGAAFQKVNFLRDLATDYHELGRSYFPDVSIDQFTEADKTRLLDDIDADLRTSAAVIGELPAGSRRAVVLAHDLFAELSRRLRNTPAATLISTRVRVPNPVKARIALAAALGRGPTR